VWIGLLADVHTVLTMLAEGGGGPGAQRVAEP
jgi:hypothetical protein